ncbi:uncharacterized protein LOC119082161 [Bradysia coprophila]|uniref:uncharacterized protein LOC119082161 n=1 Tax=Bradysia coprophila TaxID=38358 RepID=UPI00187DCEE3|nr:uncharacterized protein LOC119082161 [Bradysia coprophila]
MVSIPTVKTFCGCCDLKIPCIVIALFRMVVCIITFIILIVAFMVTGYAVGIIENKQLEHEEDREAVKVIAALIFTWLIALIPIVLIDIVTSYWFIRGAIAKDANKMKFYVYMEAVNVFMLALATLFMFDLQYFASTVVECYFAICSYSLYIQYKLSPHDDTENTVIKFENIPTPPPQYSSCEKDLNVQSTGAYPKLHP